MRVDVHFFKEPSLTFAGVPRIAAHGHGRYSEFMVKNRTYVKKRGIEIHCLQVVHPSHIHDLTRAR